MASATSREGLVEAVSALRPGGKGHKGPEQTQAGNCD
jgi:hypothetical protein